MNFLGIKSTRFNRSTYFLSSFFALFVIGVPGVTLSLILNGGAGNYALNVFIYIFVALGFYAYLILAMTKRLHDLNINGLWAIAYAIAAFIPFVNFILGLYLLSADGTNSENKYGQRPQTIEIMGLVVWRKNSLKG